jgi:hydrogenase maturation protease
MMDDGIGLRVAGELRDRLTAENTEVMIGETDVAWCIDRIRTDDFLVLLDAMCMGEAPGSVRLLPMDKAVSGRLKPYAMHELNIMDAIAAEYPEIKGVLIGIEPAEVGIGLELSECLQSGFDRICANVWILLQKVLEDWQRG